MGRLASSGVSYNPGEGGGREGGRGGRTEEEGGNNGNQKPRHPETQGAIRIGFHKFLPLRVSVVLLVPKFTWVPGAGREGGREGGNQKLLNFSPITWSNGAYSNAMSC